MINVVPLDQIEEFVGATRHPTLHLARVDTAAEMVYVLHSQECLDRYDMRPSDLRDCPFSKALDAGFEDYEWEGYYDRPVTVVVMYDEMDGGRPRLAPERKR